MFLCAVVGPPDAERSNTAPRVMLTSVKFLVVSHNVKGQKMCFAVLKACLKYIYVCTQRKICFVVVKASLKYVCVFIHTHTKPLKPFLTVYFIDQKVL